MRYNPVLKEFKVTEKISLYLDEHTGASKIVNKNSNVVMIGKMFDTPVDNQKVWSYVDKLKETYNPLKN
jgi:hypothetical protein